MTPQEMKSALQMMMDSYGKGEVDTTYQCYAEEFVFHRPPFPPIVGKEANLKADAAMLAAFTRNEMTVHEILVEGDSAAVHWTWEADHTGTSPNLGIPPTGKRIRMSGFSLYHWRDGKIIEQWEYGDLLGVLQQVGAIPAAA
jgi:steroid delta-isomerase-like uncharacterized protein